VRRSAILTASILSFLGLTYVGCTQDFDRFEPVASGASAASGGGPGGAGPGGAGSASSVSSGTGGGQPECSDDGDCDDDTTCRDWSCDGGKCTFKDESDGSHPMNSMVGNCRVYVCDGKGQQRFQPDPTDLPPDDGNPCTKEGCTQDGNVDVGDEDAGTACTLNGGGQGVCDGSGDCVGCVNNADCMGADAQCDNGECVACDDGVQNGKEDGVDCGGPVCKACPGEQCIQGDMCASGFCADQVCCDKACDGTCTSCNINGKEGTCSSLPLGEDDLFGATTCTATKTCNGKGECKLKNGQTCTATGDCASGKCSGSPKVCVQ
jgi:hypothetical protein